MLDAEAAAALVGRLRAAHAEIARRSLDARVQILDAVSAVWLGDAARRRRAADDVARATGLAAAMVDAAIARTFAAWSGDGLRAAFAAARAALAGEAEEWAAGPRSVAMPPRLVVAVLAQNTPALAVAPVYSALGLGAAIAVKSARREPSFAPALAASIAEVDAALGRACEAWTWSGGDGAVERPLFGAADRVVAYGTAETIAAVRARAGERAIAYGPRVSVAVVAAARGGLAADLPARLSREIAFADQRGCLSPQAVLVDGTVDATGLAADLARELAAMEREWPRRRLALDEAAAFRRAVDEAEAAVLSGRALALHGGAAHPWAVVVERASPLAPTPLDRFVRIHPVGDLAGLAATLAPLRDALECVGLEAADDAWPQAAAVCRDAGAARVCAIGRMQDPPADWHAGGRPPVIELLRWSAVEEPARRRAPLRRRFLAHVAQTSDEPRALEVVSARGSMVYDAEGRAWLDLLAGIGVASIGHAHPAVARAVAAQSARFTHVMVYGEDVLLPQVALAERLAELLPPSLSVAYFTNSGAEAIEGAIKLARKATGRTRILALEGAFHGDTTGALALGGNPIYRDPFVPLLPDSDRIAWSSLDELSRIDGDVAAVFAEPVQAEAGVRIPDPGYLPALAARCREVGALLVLDEVVTGLGRTGRWFAFEHWPGAVPDVLVLAKALGGGLPLGAFVASAERMRVLAHDPPLGHVTTFGGNPVSCAAALAGLDVLRREHLPERAERLGNGFRDALAALVGRGPLCAVRGLGFLIGLELASADSARRFVAACRDRGVLLGWTLHHDRVVRLAPPLTIAPEEIDRALAAIADALVA